MEEPSDVFEISKQMMGDQGDPSVHFWLSTGCLLLDLAINRGLPGGRVTEVYGDSAAGKTTLALSICRQAQLVGGIPIWLDLEGRLSLSLARKYNNIDTEQNWIYHDSNEDGEPMLLEDVTNFLLQLAKTYDSKKPLVIVIDSLAGLKSKDQEDDMGSKHQNMLIAKKLTTFFSYGLTQWAKSKNIYFIFLNQAKVAVDFKSFGPPETTTSGGKAVKFYSTVRIEIVSSSLTVAIDPNADKKKNAPNKIIGRMMTACITKNTVGPPYRKAAFPFYFYEQVGGMIGMDDSFSQLNYLIAREAIELGVTQKGTPKKGHYIINGVQNSKMGWRQRMIEEPEVASIIRDMVCKQFAEDYS